MSRTMVAALLALADKAAESGDAMLGTTLQIVASQDLADPVRRAWVADKLSELACELDPGGDALHVIAQAVLILTEPDVSP